MLQRENGGPGAARNAGVAASRGRAPRLPGPGRRVAPGQARAPGGRARGAARGRGSSTAAWRSSSSRAPRGRAGSTRPGSTEPPVGWCPGTLVVRREVVRGGRRRSTSTSASSATANGSCAPGGPAIEGLVLDDVVAPLPDPRGEPVPRPRAAQGRGAPRAPAGPMSELAARIPELLVRPVDRLRRGRRRASRPVRPRPPRRRLRREDRLVRARPAGVRRAREDVLPGRPRWEAHRLALARGRGRARPERGHEHRLLVLPRRRTPYSLEEFRGLTAVERRERVPVRRLDAVARRVPPRPSDAALPQARHAGLRAGGSPRRRRDARATVGRRSSSCPSGRSTRTCPAATRSSAISRSAASRSSTLRPWRTTPTASRSSSTCVLERHA